MKRILALTVAAAGAVAILAAPGANAAGSICVAGSITVQDTTVPVAQCIDTP